MNIKNFKTMINELHNKNLIDKYKLNSEASSEYYEKRSTSDKFSLGIAGATISSGLSLLMINENSELGKNIAHIFKTGSEKLTEICSGHPVLENLITNFQEPSISGSVLIAIGLTGIAKYAIELKYDDKLRENHNKSYIEKSLKNSDDSIASFLNQKKDTPLNIQHKSLIKNK
jgi:hypothetical protein